MSFSLQVQPQTVTVKNMTRFQQQPYANPISPNVLPFINILEVLNEILGISLRKHFRRDSKLNLDISLENGML